MPLRGPNPETRRSSLRLSLGPRPYGQCRVLKRTADRIVGRDRVEIGFQPEDAKYRGDRPERYARVTVLDFTKRHNRHSGAFGNQFRGKAAPPTSERESLAERDEAAFQWWK